MADRSRKFFVSLATGYGTILASTIYSFASIPLALSYLSKEEFGLWALALQINGYLFLVDAGMTGAVGRFLADHKDDVNGDAYIAHFATGNCVFIVQGLLVLILGMCLLPLVPGLMGIEGHLKSEFIFLLLGMCVLGGLNIAVRALASPLWGFQRMDIVNLVGGVSQLAMLPLVWAGFALGLGVRCFLVAQAILMPLCLAGYAVVCLRNGYYPRFQTWFSPRRAIFREMFSYGKDSFMLTLGGQLVNATQVTILGRTLGLDAAATFSIATKLYSMSVLFFQKVVESAAPGLAELLVRGRREQFVTRYWDLLLLTLAISSVGAVAIASGNSLFLSLWTGGRVPWSIQGDILLGMMVLVTSLSRSFVAVLGVAKNLKPIRLLYFTEGILFVPLAVVSARWLGVEGVILASLFVHILVTLAGSYRKASPILGSCRRAIQGVAQTIALILLGSALAWVAAARGLTPAVQGACALLPVATAAVLAWRFILPPEFRDRIGSHFDKLTARARF